MAGEPWREQTILYCGLNSCGNPFEGAFGSIMSKKIRFVLVRMGC